MVLVHGDGHLPTAVEHGALASPRDLEEGDLVPAWAPMIYQHDSALASMTMDWSSIVPFCL